LSFVIAVKAAAERTNRSRSACTVTFLQRSLEMRAKNA
jgi:hypothetical protein